MSRSLIHRRLGKVSAKLKDEAYARLAVCWHRGITGPSEAAELYRLVIDLDTWERADGTPVEEHVARLPRELATAIAQRLQELLADRDIALAKGQE